MDVVSKYEAVVVAGQMVMLKNPYPRDIQEPDIYERVRIHGQYSKDATSSSRPHLAVSGSFVLCFRLEIQQTRLVLYPVYTIQPVVSCKQTSNRLSNRFDNRVEQTATVRSTGLKEQLLFIQLVVKPGCTTGLTTGCIHDTASCQIGCQTGCQTGVTTG